MLRHACGYALANKGHDTRAIQGWLGHRSITSTAVYTALAPNPIASQKIFVKIGHSKKNGGGVERQS
jgi:site-specific recombinase XerD